MSRQSCRNCTVFLTTWLPMGISANVLMHSAAFQTLSAVLRSHNEQMGELTVLSNTSPVQLVVMYLHGRYSHAFAGWPVFLYPVEIYASRLGCKLGIRP